MVKQKLKDIDIKKMKMAKQVLAVFEIFGIDENVLDELITLREYKQSSEKEIAALTERVKNLETFKDETIRTINNKEKAPKKTLSQEIEESFKKDIEDFNPNA